MDQFINFGSKSFVWPDETIELEPYWYDHRNEWTFVASCVLSQSSLAPSKLTSVKLNKNDLIRFLVWWNQHVNNARKNSEKSESCDAWVAQASYMLYHVFSLERDPKYHGHLMSIKDLKDEIETDRKKKEQKQLDALSKFCDNCIIFT